MASTDMRKQVQDYYRKLYEPLVGAKVVAVKSEYDDSEFGHPYEPVTILVFKLPDTLALPSDLRGKTVDVEVWQDPEGNGPGFLSPPWEVSQ